MLLGEYLGCRCCEPRRGRRTNTDAFSNIIPRGTEPLLANDDHSDDEPNTLPVGELSMSAAMPGSHMTSPRAAAPLEGDDATWEDVYPATQPNSAMEVQQDSDSPPVSSGFEPR